MELYDVSKVYEKFNYPKEFLRIVELNLLDFDFWYLMGNEQVEIRLKGLRKRYPSRELVPFARRDDSDDIACFDIKRNNKVQIIHDFVGKGYEQKKEYDSVWDWFKEAIQEMIDKEESDGYYEDLSKEISYALRHAPWEYELEMDYEGWVSVKQLVDALNRDKKWKKTKCKDLYEMIDKSVKKRYEIRDGKIRAFYGHSIPMHIKKEKRMPPDILYHGTARRFMPSIKMKGLLPQSRQYVHLSQDVCTAKSVGARHDNKPCILKIDARRAWEDGVSFYYGNEKVWLADEVPSQYIVEM